MQKNERMKGLLIEKEEERKRLILEAELEEKRREQERKHEMQMQYQLQYANHNPSLYGSSTRPMTYFPYDDIPPLMTRININILCTYANKHHNMLIIIY